MFKGINDKFSYLNRQNPNSSSNSPPQRYYLLYSQLQAIYSPGMALVAAVLLILPKPDYSARRIIGKINLC
jgi:hypothetical protein